ncbi:MAG TPA: glycosyltransferase [Steroidobacteraceae bacterium]
MRIAQIAPLHEAVPPKLYGGTERVVSYLTEELVALGHQVTLFASGDSVTSARLHAAWPQSLRLDPNIRDVIAPHMLMLEEVRRHAEEFDVLHFHLDYWPFSMFSRQRVPFGEPSASHVLAASRSRSLPRWIRQCDIRHRLDDDRHSHRSEGL